MGMVLLRKYQPQLWPKDPLFLVSTPFANLRLLFYLDSITKSHSMAPPANMGTALVLH